MKLFLKLLLVAPFVLALDILLYFLSAKGLAYVQVHGKLLLFAIAAVNVVIGGALSGGYLEKDIAAGFRYWFYPIRDKKGRWNPTYGFALLTLIINLYVVIFGIEP